jgi:hypothetical protein
VLGRGDGEFEHGYDGGVTKDRGARKLTPAPRREFSPPRFPAAQHGVQMAVNE